MRAREDEPFAAARAEDGALAGEEFVLFDGACGLCTWLARRARAASSPSLRWLPYQWLTASDFARLGTTRERCARAVQYVERGGRIFAGADAVNRYFARRRAGRLAVAVLRVAFPLLLLERLGYALAAHARGPLSALLGTRRCALIRDEERSR